MKSTCLADVIVELQSGARPKGGVNDAGDVLSIGAEHLSDDGGIDLQKPKRIPRGFFDHMRSGHIRYHDILIVKDGATTGKVAFVGTPFAAADAAVNEHVFRLQVDNSKADPEFVFRYLQSPAGQVQILRGFRGATVGGITRTFAENVRMTLPPLAEQRRIAAMLDKADAVRRKRWESLKLLDEFLRSAFLEMFGDPVRNEKGWEVVRLGDVIVDAQYGTSARANSDGRGLPIIRMNNIRATGAIDLFDIKWCEVPSRDIEKHTVRRGDLLFNRTNSPELVGKTAVWDRDDTFAVAGYLIRVRFDESRVVPQFVSGYLNSPYGKRMLFERAKPSINMSNISATDLKRLSIILPPLAQQRRFVALQAKVSELADRAGREESASASLYNSLAQRAFRTV